MKRLQPYDEIPGARLSTSGMMHDYMMMIIVLINVYKCYFKFEDKLFAMKGKVIIALYSLYVISILSLCY